ncbi:MAG: GNAT family N-acetyltransferase [Saprospiraceae bacterium]|nr:GNAT family N-acetyltransferase [Saprospiraceae bacterium]MBK8449810.1 GNAT family N-acetyltransferase [Saprospiraceae bacterium]MBK9221536.1 GNAT family N-acetyltransferase [Saprospiraceae bacterium]MBK9721527.1 GNAT family N-acetyltransferase [Saprospiraceae bacterium]
MQDPIFSPIEFLSPEYDSCVKLRDQELRKPLNLEFTSEQLEEESNQFHFGLFDDEMILFACLTFKEMPDLKLKMRQVVVSKQYQFIGFGKILVFEAEQWAILNGYSEIILHARDTAIPFYEKCGYQKIEDSFIEVNILHWKMSKVL